jgi:signal transduction histidine kinase
MRHGSPRRVRINLYTQQPAVTLEVHDDGTGFDLAQAKSTPSGLGLQSMRERLSLVDGWLDIKTARGSGTTVSATIPLDALENIAHEEIA